MNKTQYQSLQTTNNSGEGLFPLSIQSLEFIQNQIVFLQNLTRIAGDNYIIKQPTKSEDGLVVFDGELLPLKYGVANGRYICIRETRSDIVADGVMYKNARISHVAGYSNSSAGYFKSKPASAFATLKTNQTLAYALQNYSGIQNVLASKLNAYTLANVTKAQLDGLKDNAVVNCPKGGLKLNGADEYSIQVYKHSKDNITQIQVLPNGHRYVRYWDTARNDWGGFTPLTDNLHIDVKIVNGTKVFIRHGYVPEGVQLVLLRKKKRGNKRSCAGGKLGRERLRLAKNQYCHYKGVILSTSAPNKWYVPKCIGVCDLGYQNLIGKELASICESMIKLANRTRRPYDDGVYQVCGTRIKASLKGHVSETQGSCYARIALQFATAGATFKGAGGEPANMKYRLWFDEFTGKVMRTLTTE